MDVELEAPVSLYNPGDRDAHVLKASIKGAPFSLPHISSLLLRAYLIKLVCLCFPFYTSLLKFRIFSCCLECDHGNEYMVHNMRLLHTPTLPISCKETGLRAPTPFLPRTLCTPQIYVLN